MVVQIIVDIHVADLVADIVLLELIETIAPAYDTNLEIAQK